MLDPGQSRTAHDNEDLGGDPLLREAEGALRRGDLRQAGEFFMTVARRAPERGEAWIGMARVLVSMKEFDRALELVDRAMAPDHKAQAWVTLAGELVTQREFGRAHEIVGRALAIEPTHAGAHAVQAVVFQSTGDEDAAMSTLERAVELSPDDAQLWEALIALIETLLGAEAALGYLDRHGDLVPRTITIEYMRAQLYVLTGHMRTAERQLRLLVEENPEHVDLGVRFARFLAELGEEHESIERLQRLIAQPETGTDPLIALADVLRGENTTLPDAIAILQQAIELQPDNTLLFRKQADCHARCGRYIEAAQALITAIGKDGSGSVEDHLRLGTLLRHGSYEDAATTHLERARQMAAADLAEPACEQRPEDRAAMAAVLGRILVALGRRDDALACYKRMLGDRPHVGLVYDPAYYLPGTPERLQRLREIIRGRDVMLLCHGPSIAQLGTWHDRLRSLDVAIAALNRFRVFETGFLAAAGRSIDVLLQTHFKTVRPHLDQIMEFLDRPTSNLLITARWVLDRLGKTCSPRTELEARYDHKLLYFGGTGGIQPATPYHPLRYAYGNSLSTLISLLTIGGARRIFLFGADGGVPPATPGDTHYGADSEDFRVEMTPALRAAVSASLRADTADFDDAVTTGLLTAEALHGTPAPDIFNVSPSSALRPFSKITYDEAWDLLGTS